MPAWQHKHMMVDCSWWWLWWWIWSLLQLMVTLLYVKTQVWTCACVTKSTSSASCSWWWFFYMSKRRYGHVLVLPSRRLVRLAADDDFATCRKTWSCFRTQLIFSNLLGPLKLKATRVAAFNHQCFQVYFDSTVHMFSTSKKDQAFVIWKSIYYAIWYRPLILRSCIC